MPRQLSLVLKAPAPLILNIHNMVIVPLKQIEYGIHGDLIIIYPKPYSIDLRGTLYHNGNIQYLGVGGFTVF